MSDHFSEAADACLALAYRYNNIRDCVLNQCPWILSDHKLSNINSQLEILMLAFDARVKALSEGATHD